MRIIFLLAFINFVSLCFGQKDSLTGKQDGRHEYIGKRDCGTSQGIKSQTQILRFPNSNNESGDTTEWQTMKNATSYYDKNGRIIRIEVYRKDGSIENLYQNEYNEGGKLIKSKGDGNIFHYYYDKKDSLVKVETYGEENNLEEIRTYSYSYDSNTLPSPYMKTGDTITISVMNILDKSNHIIAIESFNDGVYYKTLSEYNDSGNMILEESLEDSDLVEIKTFTYKNGKLSMEKINEVVNTTMIYNENEQLIKTISDRGRVQINSFNEKGNIASTFEYSNDQIEEIVRYAYEFY